MRFPCRFSWLVILVLGCSGAESPRPTPTESPVTTSTTDDPGEASTDVAALRPALSGASVSDEEVGFIHESLRRWGGEYTEDGLLTFVEWELVARVESSSERYELMVAGPRVNAEWELFIDRRTGEVTEGMVATLAEEPPDDESDEP